MPTESKSKTCPNCADKDKLKNCADCDCPSAEEREGECSCPCHKKAKNCKDKDKTAKNRRGVTACLLLNRDFQLPEDGWYHITPRGEFIHPRTGLLQVIDQEACELIVNRFAAEKTDENFPGILVDYDHFSLDDKQPSEAAGWIEEMQNRDSGVWARIRWSDTGEQAVKGGRYRLVSPVWTLADCQQLDNKRVRPLRIDSVALTNDPNLKGLTPLSNRCAETGSTEPPPTKDTMDHKLMLVTLLGLAATATDAEIESSVGLANRRLQESGNSTKRLSTTLTALGLKEDATDEVIVNRCTGLVKENETLKAQQQTFLEAQVEQDLVQFADVIGNRDAVKKGLLANRDSMLEVLKALKKPAGSKTPLHNRNTAKNPEDNFDKDGNTDAPEADKVRAAKISNRVTELRKANRRLDFSTAWKMAAKEIETKELASK